ncbi:excinuclease ABC subunit UvrB [Desulforegula conservatrix]|uniref:excinuclease ABC subunit UvrB n=1 Tax=Desulforegula conservatrix TaxID=153026 RepID=UPI00040E623D|nr:excinuclease ABC subunit UvrB [Desulforegula conservatrix]
MDEKFKIISSFTPKGHQPKAIETLSKGIISGKNHQTLVGVTGSGKTFTMAHVIANCNRPALVIAPNKTLAAQLYHEFKGLFPESAVEYFVSYYDYYQPEAYIPTTDTYIQKDSAINEMIDKMRHSATRSVLTRRDVLVVASVSCIYGLGAPEDYLAMRIELGVDDEHTREKLLKDLVSMHYERNDMDFHRGVFRVRGDRVEIFPAYEEDVALRIEFFGDFIESISEIDPLKGSVTRKLKKTAVFPGSHYVTMKETRTRAIETISAELALREAYFKSVNKLIEAQRIVERTNFDLEMIEELGYCNGIENYSRHLTGRNPGEPPPTLLDYFPDDLIVFLDESHMAVPQIRAMYSGDQSRKSTLAEFGFRLPSALDNRPLKFEEFNKRAHQVIYVSATPADYEYEVSGANLVEQIVRPTGLVDPLIDIRSAETQVDNLLEEIRLNVEKGGRVLITTLTKRMAEDLTDYYTDFGIRVKYLHSDIKTLERMDIIRSLRLGEFDVLIGINLLREGLDIPEVSLVAIMDADKEGFLRSTRALIQTFGRAARNVGGKVILYADRMTDSMRRAIDETDRRRKIQEEYNIVHGIIPTTIEKEVSVYLPVQEKAIPQDLFVSDKTIKFETVNDIEAMIKTLDKEMKEAAKELMFEKAAQIRDRIKSLRALEQFG